MKFESGKTILASNYGNTDEKVALLLNDEEKEIEKLICVRHILFRVYIRYIKNKANVSFERVNIMLFH